MKSCDRSSLAGRGHLVRLLTIFVAAVLLSRSDRADAGEPGAVGDLYVTGFSSNNVVQFDAQTGALVGEFVSAPTGGLNNPSGLVFGPNGNLFVCSFMGHSVREYDGTTGVLIGELIPGTQNQQSGWLLGPRALLSHPDGRLLVAGNDNSAVLSYDAVTGEWLGTFAVGGTNPGGLFEPVDLVVGHNDNILVPACDASIHDPQSWGTFPIFEYHAATGLFVGVFASGLHSPMRCTFGPNGNLFVVNYFANDVVELDGQTGDPVGTFVSGGGLTKPRGLTFGPNGNLLVAGRLDGMNGVIEYDGQTGALIGMFATGMLSNPDDLVFKPAPPNPMAAPTVTGISVGEVDACDGLSGVTVAGTNLDPANTIVKLSHDDEPVGSNGLLATYVGVVTGGSPDGTSLTVDFDLNGGARMGAGLWDVVVVNPDGQLDTLPAAIDVAPCRAAIEENLFVLGYRHRAVTRHGLFEYDGVSGDLIGFMVEDRSGSDGDDLANSRGLVLGYDGNLVITGGVFTDGRVLLYDGITGRELGTFIPAGTGGMLRPRRLTFGPNGNLFVLHTSSACTASGVLEFDGLTGAFVRDFVPLDTCGLRCACDLEFGPNGNVYVTDCTCPSVGTNGGVYVFDGQTGECLAAPLIGVFPEYPDINTHSALEFSPHDGNLVLPWRTPTVPAGLARVTEHDPETGDLVATPIPPPAGDIQQAIASDFGPKGPGHLFVAGYPDYVFEYDLVSGAVLGIFANQATASGTAAANEIMFQRRAGDANDDWDLDLGDFGAFQRCFGSEGVMPGDYNCLKHDQDFDGDVDLDDLAGFTAAMTGPK